ncbi:hypothetical protein [Nocardioides humi]|uniref:hypothetical protein n=1 Tax=Nocardioides humi TaxID=449461 RepID=UPI0011275B6D|nr:hypothetical protein [Nocardioides humi]
MAQRSRPGGRPPPRRYRCARREAAWRRRSTNGLIPGTTQALTRTETIEVIVEGRAGTILRPNLVGALVGKAAARVELGGGRAASRHCVDFVVLASLLTARDLRESPLDRKDRQRLSRMIPLCRKDGPAMLVEDADEHLGRLQRAIDR